MVNNYQGYASLCSIYTVRLIKSVATKRLSVTWPPGARVWKTRSLSIYLRSSCWLPAESSLNQSHDCVLILLVSSYKLLHGRATGANQVEPRIFTYSKCSMLRPQAPGMGHILMVTGENKLLASNNSSEYIVVFRMKHYPVVYTTAWYYNNKQGAKQYVGPRSRLVDSYHN